MESKYLDIAKILQRFETIDIVVNNDNKEEKTVPYYVMQLAPIYLSEAQELESCLTALYLSGNISTMQKVQAELIRIKAKLEKFATLKIEISEPEQYNIEPEQLKEINEMKLSYINQTIKFLHEYIPVQAATISEIEELKEKITMPEAALLLVYRNVTLKDPRTDAGTDREQNAKIWAERFGFDNLGSGEVLFRRWQGLNKKNGITGFDETQVQKIKNMITRIEKITPYLKKPEQQARAADDIQKLKTKLN